MAKPMAEPDAGESLVQVVTIMLISLCMKGCGGYFVWHSMPHVVEGYNL